MTLTPWALSSPLPTLHLLVTTPEGVSRTDFVVCKAFALLTFKNVSPLAQAGLPPLAPRRASGCPFSSSLHHLPVVLDADVRGPFGSLPPVCWSIET